MKARHAGFTLVELVFTVLVFAILLSVGVPGFRDFARNARLTETANDLIAEIGLARSETIKRRVPVTLCAVGDPEAADPCADGDFANGWLVFTDEDGSGGVNGGDVVLEWRGAPGGDLSLSVYEPDPEDDGAWAASDTTSLTYGPNGFRRAPGGAMPADTAVVICDGRGNVATSAGPEFSAARMIEVSTIGRAAVTRVLESIEERGGCPQ